MDPGAQEWRWPPEKLENVGQQVVPQPHEGRQPCQHPDFRQDSFWTSKLQNCEIKKLCCFSAPKFVIIRHGAMVNEYSDGTVEKTVRSFLGGVHYLVT